MRSLGQFARTEELQQMLQEVDVDGKGIVLDYEDNFGSLHNNINKEYIALQN
nr:unnamed protein product [Callosobruchus analis]